MEDLIRSLISLGLHPPTPSQLTDLLSDNKQDQKRLAQLLSLSTISNPDEDDDDDLTSGLMTQDLIVEGVQSLLQNFNQSIEREKSLYQKEIQALEKPVPLKLVPMKALLARQESDLRRNRNDRSNILKIAKGGVAYQPKLILDVGTSHCSTRSLFDLKRMNLDRRPDLKVPKRYNGEWLLCKVISEINHYVGVTFIISDEKGNCIPVSVAHFLPQDQLNSLFDQPEALSEFLPIGTIIAIKEPFISFNHYTRSGPTSSKQVIGIRIDSPDDLVIFSGESIYDDLGWKEVEFKDEISEIGRENEGRNGIDTREGRWGQEGFLTRLAFENRRLSRTEPETEREIQYPPQSILKRTRKFLKEKRKGAAYREFLAAKKFRLLPSLPSILENSSASNEVLAAKSLSMLAQINLDNDRLDETDQISLLLQTLSLELTLLDSLECWEEMISNSQASLKLISSLSKEASLSNLTSAFEVYRTRFSQALSKSQLLSSTSQPTSTGPTSSQIQSFYALSQTSLSPNMESPHYVDSKVVVKDLSEFGKGRGLVLEGDVEPGELLLCCKALGAAYPVQDEADDDEDEKFYEESSPASKEEFSTGANGKEDRTNGKLRSGERVLETILRLNFEKNSMARTSQVKAATNVIHALMDQPFLNLPFLGLTAGPIPDSPYVSQPYPLRWKSSPSSLHANLDLIEDKIRGKGTFIDAAYVEGVLSFNAFGPGIGPGRSDGLEKKSGRPQVLEPKDENAMLEKGQRDSKTSSKPIPVELTGEFARSTMPHPLPAIMNHSCLPNVSSVFLGDIVTTRSLHHLPKGTEIVHQYVRGEEPFYVRQAMTLKHGFDCGCPLCELDNRDGEVKRREREGILKRELPTAVERSRIVLKPRFKFQEPRSTGNVNASSMNENHSSNETALENGVQSLDLDPKEIEAHEEIQSHLISLISKIEETYHEQRGSLKPDLFEIWHRVALHSEAVGKFEEAVEYELNALRSAGAIPTSDPLPSNLRPDLPMTSTDEVIVGGMKSSNMRLKRLPDLHFDNALQSMLNIANLLLPGSAAESSNWVSTAFWLHECVIAGGISVFLDRWANGVDLDLEKWNDVDAEGNGGLRGMGDGMGLLEGKWKMVLENWLRMKG